MDQITSIKKELVLGREEGNLLDLLSCSLRILEEFKTKEEKNKINKLLSDLRSNPKKEREIRDAMIELIKEMEGE